MDYRNITIDQSLALSDTLVIPLGSVEQHGHHLPVTSDCIIVQAQADAIGAALDACVLPVIPVSTCAEHRGKRGTFAIDPVVYYNYIMAILDSARLQGYKKAVLLVGHGGLFIIAPLVRWINAKYAPDFMTCRAACHEFPEEYRKVGFVFGENNVHSEEYETSIMLHLVPELVDMSKALDCIPEHSPSMLNHLPLLSMAPDGVWGCATRATAEKGKLYLETGINATVAYIGETFGLMAKHLNTHPCDTPLGLI